MRITGYSGDLPLNKVTVSLRNNLGLPVDEARQIAIDIRDGKVIDLEYDMVLAEDLKDYGVYVS